MVANEGWTYEETNSIRNIALYERVDVMFIQDKDEFIEYLNSKSKRYIPRLRSPVMQHVLFRRLNDASLFTLNRSDLAC